MLCGPPCGCRELNPGLLEEQQVLLPLSLLSSPSNCFINIFKDQLTDLPFLSVFKSVINFTLQPCIGKYNRQGRADQLRLTHSPDSLTHVPGQLTLSIYGLRNS